MKTFVYFLCVLLLGGVTGTDEGGQSGGNVIIADPLITLTGFQNGGGRVAAEVRLALGGQSGGHKEVADGGQNGGSYAPPYLA